MREKLEKKKTELAERQAKFYDESFGAGVHVGWNHCQDELLPLIEEMRKTLEFYADVQNYEEITITEEAQATTWFRESTEIQEDSGQKALSLLTKLKQWEES